MIDKKTLALGFAGGLIVGLVLAYFLVIYGLSVTLGALQVHDVYFNLSIPLNETRLIEAMNDTIIAPRMTPAAIP